MPRPPRLSSPLLATLAAAVLVVTLSACRHDGRTLAPSKPDQTNTIRTTTTPASTTSTTTAGDGDASIGMALRRPWAQGQPIGTGYTCKGADVSPALTWTGVPDGTVELAIVMVDLDAQGYAHWIISGLDPKRGGILESEVPDGAHQANNSKGTLGYTGPCPPAGATHTYQVTLHAFREPLAIANGMDPTAAMGLIEDKSVAATTLSGTFAG